MARCSLSADPTVMDLLQVNRSEIPGGTGAKLLGYVTRGQGI